MFKRQAYILDNAYPTILRNQTNQALTVYKKRKKMTSNDLAMV